LDPAAKSKAFSARRLRLIADTPNTSAAYKRLVIEQKREFDVVAVFEGKATFMAGMRPNSLEWAI
jgi:hypothetical protein